MSKISRREANRSKHNKKYRIEERLELIRLVLEEKYSIQTAGDSLGFKRSTAKRIVKDYRTMGKITVFKNQRQDADSDSNQPKLENAQNKDQPQHIQNSIQKQYLQPQSQTLLNPVWFPKYWPQQSFINMPMFQPQRTQFYGPSFGYLNNYYF